jgi:hypothetical protein
MKSCCQKHKEPLNFKKINEQYFAYKKKRKFIDKYPLKLSDIKRVTSDPVAIIVPYRDNPEQNRAKQLKDFIDYYHDYLPNVDIYIVEQDEGKKFNRGILLNIGFKLAKDFKDYKRYIFHDVDLISPKELRKVYTYSDDLGCPIHIASLWTEKYNFSTFLGGIISFSKEDYELINGFPNCFFGWGGEDDAMYNRLAITDIPINYLVSEEGVEIKGMEHPQSKSDNNEKKENILRDLKLWKKDGLNNLEDCYKILAENKVKYDNVAKITVHI